MSELTKFDHYLSDDGPAALVIREWLTPVEGPDGVVFPATFAAGDTFEGGYNIDGDPNGKNVCLIDSVGSQANRIEPIFMSDQFEGKLKRLVPQVVVEAGDKRVNLLEAGHRAGDALLRCSSLEQELKDAFKELLRGDASKLAKIAPTSLVFGVWDSRDTQAKLPRVVASTIRAYNVRPLRRGAVYLPPLPYVEEGLVDASLDTGKGKDNPLSVKGFKHNPASGSHGGVIAEGGIRRDATLSLAALRLLRAGDQTQALKRYILGLALVAFTANTSAYLRQGCLLVLDASKSRDFVEVHPTGERKPVEITQAAAVAYATATAVAFGIDPNAAPRVVAFSKPRAHTEITGKQSESGTVTGKASQVKATEKTFAVRQGKTTFAISTNEETKYLKGGAESSFAEVVKNNNKLEVELADGVAVKVSAE